jgi:hypothetical protein
MKFLFRTNFVSNEYWDDTAFALVTLDQKDFATIRTLTRESRAFLNRIGKIRHVSYAGSTSLDFPGSVEYFDDDEAETFSKLIGDDEGAWARVAADFEVPDGTALGRTELHRLMIHHDGDLWLKSNSKDSGDYVEVELPSLSALRKAEIHSLVTIPGITSPDPAACQTLSTPATAAG